MLDTLYFEVIATRFWYRGLIDNRSMVNGVLSWAILFGFYFLARKILISDSNRKSGIIFYILFLVSFVPFTTCIYAGLVTTGFIIYNSTYWFVLIICLRFMENISVRTFPRIKVGSNLIGDKILTLVGIASMMLVVFISWKYSNFRLHFDLFTAYNIRYEARNYDFPRILTYLFSWTFAINPIFLGICLVKKRWLMAGMILCVQMLSFGVNGLKTTFFLPLLVIVFVFIYNDNGLRKLKRLIILSLCFFMGAGCFEYFSIHTTFISDLFVRRMLIVPNQLGEYYFDYFSSNPPDYFRSSFLRHVGVQSPYTENGQKGFTYLIGQKYFGKTTANCNNGLSSDAIANFGYFGCIIMPVFLAYCLKLVDRSMINVNDRISITPIIYISYNLLSTTLTTVLLTHGLLVIIVLMSLIGNNQIRKYN